MCLATYRVCEGSSSVQKILQDEQSIIYLWNSVHHIDRLPVAAARRERHPPAAGAQGCAAFATKWRLSAVCGEIHSGRKRLRLHLKSVSNPNGIAKLSLRDEDEEEEPGLDMGKRREIDSFPVPRVRHPDNHIMMSPDWL